LSFAGETANFVDFKMVLQRYINAEKNMDKDESCSGKCTDFREVKNFNMSRCIGTLRDCDDLDVNFSITMYKPKDKNLIHSKREKGLQSYKLVKKVKIFKKFSKIFVIFSIRTITICSITATFVLAFAINMPIR
jgi:hypothetical protein